MFRLIIPVVLILGSIGLFVSYTNPTYKSLGELRATYAAYNEALANSKKLFEIRNELTTKYNSLSVTDREKLETLLPDNIDNIRFILDIEEISRPHGRNMRPRDVKYDPNAQNNTGQTPTAQTTPSQLQALNRDYGEFQLDFSVSGTYDTFVKFVKDMERNLRIIDIEEVTFSTPVDGSNIYKYNFRVKTYWLKN